MTSGPGQEIAFWPSSLGEIEVSTNRRGIGIVKRRAFVCYFLRVSPTVALTQKALVTGFSGVGNAPMCILTISHPLLCIVLMAKIFQ